MTAPVITVVPVTAWTNRLKRRGWAYRCATCEHTGPLAQNRDIARAMSDLHLSRHHGKQP